MQDKSAEERSFLQSSKKRKVLDGNYISSSILFSAFWQDGNNPKGCNAPSMRNRLDLLSFGHQ